MSGSSTSKIVATSATLDLTGKSVSGLTIHSNNTAGTTFTVDSKSTAFLVSGGDGADTLNATTFAFSALEREAIFATTSIETIQDTSGFYGNDAPNTILGTAAADNIEGADGADVITGAGGADALAGGIGADTFVFNLPSDGVDTISDLGTGVDHLGISATGFGGGLTAGGTVELQTTTDFTSVASVNTTGQFIYDTHGTDAGTVYWDADGNSGSNAVAIAKLQNQVALQATDFLLL
jgi:Ca2+-binding RTX toxin-like protein